jgi:hypothetical protein
MGQSHYPRAPWWIKLNAPVTRIQWRYAVAEKGARRSESEKRAVLLRSRKTAHKEDPHVHLCDVLSTYLTPLHLEAAMLLAIELPTNPLTQKH